MGKKSRRSSSSNEKQQAVGWRVVQRIDAPEIAAELLDEEDHIIRSFAAKSLAKSVDLHSTFADDLHHSVRIVAAENSSMRV